MSISNTSPSISVSPSHPLSSLSIKSIPSTVSTNSGNVPLQPQAVFHPSNNLSAVSATVSHALEQVTHLFYMA